MIGSDSRALRTSAIQNLLVINCVYVHTHTRARAHTHTHTHTHTELSWLLFLRLRERGAKTKIAFCAAQVRARVSRRVVFETHGRINYTFLNVPSIYFIVIFLYKQQDLTQRNTKYILKHFCVYEYANSPRDIQMSGYFYRRYTFFIIKIIKITIYEKDFRIKLKN